jgi:NAD(P)-dependent dehydrogenase (short-subunit alcohol dehydrogenase family)
MEPAALLFGRRTISWRVDSARRAAASSIASTPQKNTRPMRGITATGHGTLARMMDQQSGVKSLQRGNASMAATRSTTRVALVTGASGAIGGAIARCLAACPGYRVVLVARDPGRANVAAETLREATGNADIHGEHADLALKADIDALARRWQGPLHVLVNDAAETPREREVTTEGIERQFATNVLGYFRLTRALTPALRSASPARVVNVASYWAGGLDLEDLEFRHRRYDNDSAYRQSKQADRMLSVAFADRLRADGITVNACHPGDVRSRLAVSLGFGGHESPEQAAATPVWLATEAVGGEVTGGYFEHQRQTTCRFAADAATIEALYAACSAYD